MYLHIFIYVYVYMYMFIYSYIYLNIYICVCVRVPMCVHVQHHQVNSTFGWISGALSWPLAKALSWKSTLEEKSSTGAHGYKQKDGDVSDRHRRCDICIYLLFIVNMMQRMRCEDKLAISFLAPDAIWQQPSAWRSGKWFLKKHHLILSILSKLYARQIGSFPQGW